LTLVSPFYFAEALKLKSDSVLRGAGACVVYERHFTELVIRVCWLAFSRLFRLLGIWYACPCWITATVISFICYKNEAGKKLRLLYEPGTPVYLERAFAAGAVVVANVTEGRAGAAENDGVFGFDIFFHMSGTRVARTVADL
jgi:hypothetical protein